MKKTAVFICGPTAVGKTSVAIDLARWMNTEIISFDSRQFFQELKIGAAPPSESEQQKVKHHLTGHLSIQNEYSAGEFEKDALFVLEKIFRRKNNAVLVGGSGLYMQALTSGFDAMPVTEPGIREQLNREFKEKGLIYLQQELREKDPAYFNTTDQKNPQRLIRALEVIRSTGGKPYSSFREKKTTTRHFNIIKIGLTLPREELYARINRRADEMIGAGLEQEAQLLFPYREKNALQTVGYTELFQYLQGKISKEKAVDEIKKNSRRYAKRQLTWFRRDDEIQWFSPLEIDKIKEYLQGLDFFSV